MLLRLGLGGASRGKRLTIKEINWLKALHLSHLRADVHLASSEVETTLQQAVDQARALGVSLELALHVTNNAESELQAFVNSLIGSNRRFPPG